jgi:L-seryl-tRNA(Ser) seleniumtransferase
MDAPLAALPAVHDLLRDPSFAAACGGVAAPYRARLVRDVVAGFRDALRAGRAPGGDLRDAVLAACIAEARALQRPFPRRVVNGTGVLAHTNLGRAPLGELLDAVDADALAGYSDLEWDASDGGRGERDRALRRQLRFLTDAEDALAVNNCAGALFLALNTLAAGRAVLVSRSELVEIGGSFRVPDIMAASGCTLREVGTTNRTRIEDFEAHAEGAAVLLKVHQSNFVQRGFVQQVGLPELAALGRRLGVPVVEDNGSGLLAEGTGLDDEPHLLAGLRAGADVLCCSADKLLGCVQAGIILGRGELIRRMRTNPLYRALRLDKVRLALLDAALRRYLAGDADGLPLWRLYRAPVDEVRARLDALRLPGPESRWLRCETVPLQGTLGGGTSPETTFASVGLALEHRDLSAEAVRRWFAARAVPVVGYVRQERFHLDARTLLDGDLLEVQRALDELGGDGGGSCG